MLFALLETSMISIAMAEPAAGWPYYGVPVAGLWNFTNYGPPRSFGFTGNLRYD